MMGDIETRIGGSAGEFPTTRDSVVVPSRKGRDPDLNRDVAMKVLHPGHAGNPAMIRRFIEEAQIGGQLQHPGPARTFMTIW